MVRAILEGRKAQTRRIVKPQPDPLGLHNHDRAPMSLQDELTGWRGCTDDTGEGREWKPYAEVGDRLWVRETHLIRGAGTVVDYRADMDPIDAAGHGAFYGGWKPSLFMRREHSRITLEVESVRAERLQGITRSDIRDEGILVPAEFASDEKFRGYLLDQWIKLWESINGPGSWEANPWVWCISFRKL